MCHSLFSTLLTTEDPDSLPSLAPLAFCFIPFAMCTQASAAETS